MTTIRSGSEPFVIVGAGPAAHAAAVAYRSHGGTGTVLMITDDEALPYHRPPLSKDYLRGDLAEEDAGRELALTSQADLDEAGVGIQLGRAVVGLDPQRRTLTTADGGTISYGHCLLATGSEPVTLPVPGGDLPSMHRLRSLTDARRLRRAAETAETAKTAKTAETATTAEMARTPGHVVVVGSGFIGCEAAVSLARRGLRVTLVSDEPRPQRGRLGDHVSGRITAWLESEGVTGRFGAEVTGFEDVGGRFTVGLDDGDLDADLVLCAVGVRPRSDLAEAAGIPTEGGRILVDEGMRTPVDGVLAAGDVALAMNPTAGRRLRVEHWGEALEMGEVAGTVAAGGSARWDGVPGFWSQIGDRTLKYVAWGDGFDAEQVKEHAGGGFTVRYGLDGVLVGVLTHEADDDYEAGRKQIADGERL